MTTSCELVYDIVGVAKADDLQLLQAFRDEVASRLEHVKAVEVCSVDGGVGLKIVVTDIEPWDQNDFEVFVFAHAVEDSTHAYFDFDTAAERIEFRLVSERYGW